MLRASSSQTEVAEQRLPVEDDVPEPGEYHEQAGPLVERAWEDAMVGRWASRRAVRRHSVGIGRGGTSGRASGTGHARAGSTVRPVVGPYLKDKAGERDENERGCQRDRDNPTHAVAPAVGVG